MHALKKECAAERAAAYNLRSFLTSTSQAASNSQAECLASGSEPTGGSFFIAEGDLLHGWQVRDCQHVGMRTIIQLPDWRTEVLVKIRDPICKGLLVLFIKLIIEFVQC